MNWFKRKRILVPIDFSDESIDAVRVALQLAERREDIHVLHVMPQILPSDPNYIPDSDKRRKEHVRKRMTEELSNLGVDNIHLDVDVGNASAVIARLAEEIGAGLIVIPSHGRTGVKRLLLGSVAERAVRLAHCPILVLKKAE